MDNTIPWSVKGYFEEADAWIESHPKQQSANRNPKKLILKIHSHWEEDNWKNCLETANKLIDLAPEISAGWLYSAIAVREMGSPKKALKILLPIAPRFPDSREIPFHIACFYSASKQCEKAEEWLEKARGLSEEYVIMNELCTPDLEAYWDYRRETGKTYPYCFSDGDE